MADESNIRNNPMETDDDLSFSEELDNDEASTDASEDRNKEDNI